MALVTNNELVELTGGLKQGAAQIRWIEKHLGIKCPRKIDGHPMLTWEQINRPVEQRRRNEPNWAAL